MLERMTSLACIKRSLGAALTATALPLALAGALCAQSAAADHGAMKQVQKAPVPPSHSLIVNFQGRLTTISVEDLLKLPQVTVHVHNAHRNRDEDYTGPLLSDVLARAGLSGAHENEQNILRSAIVATGTDHYFVLYSCAEVEPAFSSGKVIVAVMKGDLPDTEGGMIQLVNTTDTKPARWVHGLADLNVVAMDRSSM
jgi:hypothetical protein